ncbi:hypothetical protein M8J76_008889 [Diaphorina citri]|nr:hypothetical protein M8J76_008889 [Diaphorina citri]
MKEKREEEEEEEEEEEDGTVWCRLYLWYIEFVIFEDNKSKDKKEEEDYYKTKDNNKKKREGEDSWTDLTVLLQVEVYTIQ